MYLKSIEYSEHMGAPQAWAVKKLEFGNINLIVGKNSSGKSRVLNVINALAQALSGKSPAFGTGTWTAEFDRLKGLQHEQQIYSVSYADGGVAHERFKIKSDLVMERGAAGDGYVMNRKAGRVKYKVARDRLMAVMKSDQYQHPQFEHIQNWAANVCIYRFGTDFGKGTLAMQNQPSSTFQNDSFDMSGAVDNPPDVFIGTFEKFGQVFKEILLSDLNSIGYPCEDIGMLPVQNIRFGGISPLGLALKEYGLDCVTTQADMSQGLYRALALLIQFNANILWAQSKKVGRELVPGDSPMIVIDDIGEGLDYDRSKRLIAVLVEKALRFKVQILMSSNDRFIMNDVPLEYWTVLHREGCVVRPFNYYNSKEMFDEFEYLGLNNFDFFSNEYFKTSHQG